MIRAQPSVTASPMSKPRASGDDPPIMLVVTAIAA